MQLEALQIVELLRLVGALCFSRGKQRFSVAGKSSMLIMRFSAGLEKPRAKARSLR